MSLTSFVSVIAWPIAFTIVGIVVALAIAGMYQDRLIYRAKMAGHELALEPHSIKLNLGGSDED